MQNRIHYSNMSNIPEVSKITADITVGMGKNNMFKQISSRRAKLKDKGKTEQTNHRIRGYPKLKRTHKDH